MTKSSCQPSAPNIACRLSAKKLKYLKNPSSTRLNPRLTQRSALPPSAATRLRPSHRPQVKSTSVDAIEQPEKPPVPRRVEVVARHEQQPVLRSMRQQPVGGVDDDEEPDEVKGVEDHRAITAAGGGVKRPGVAQELLQRLGDDLVAARRQVNGALEEQVGARQRAPQRREDIEPRRRHARERLVEPARGGVAHQLASRLRHRFPQPPDSPRRPPGSAPASASPRSARRAPRASRTISSTTRRVIASPSRSAGRDWPHSSGAAVRAAPACP